MSDTTETNPAWRAWEAVADECPRKLGAVLHRAGQHLHLKGWGGRVSCCDAWALIPEGDFTEAQVAAWRASQAEEEAAG